MENLNFLFLANTVGLVLVLGLLEYGAKMNREVASSWSGIKCAKQFPLVVLVLYVFSIPIAVYLSFGLLFDEGETK